MSEMITDGTGSGAKAKVDTDHRLRVLSISVPMIANKSHDGEAYFIASDFVALTTIGSFNGILYFKYTGSTTFSIDGLRTCGNQIQEWKLILSPSAGTLISDANSGFKNNLNISSTKTIDLTVYAASGDGKTITDGTHAGQWINGVGHSTTNFNGSLILSKNDTVALVCKPGAAGDFCVTIIGHEGSDI